MPRSTDTVAALSSSSLSHSTTASPLRQQRRVDIRSAADPSPTSTTTALPSRTTIRPPSAHGPAVRNASTTTTATDRDTRARTAPSAPTVARCEASRLRSRPATPNIMDISNDNDDNEIMDDNTTTAGSTGAKVIYTPASTVSSGLNSSCTEVEAAEYRRLMRRQSGGSGGSDWLRDEALSAHFGNLSKELVGDLVGELRILLKQGSDDGASDVVRLKQDHRASLASLAASHRKEIDDLKQAHKEALRKMELDHMEDLKDAKRNNGHDRDLLKGLRDSYGKQIENLILDLAEAKREVQELQLKGPIATSDTTRKECLYRELDIKVQFENLDAPFHVAELTVPHPGSSFEKLNKVLACTVKNHLKTLHDSANFFLPRLRDDHVNISKCIHHFYHAIKARNVQFHFRGENQQKLWEEEQWRISDVVLEVDCTTDGWEQVHRETIVPEESGGVNIDFQEIDLDTTPARRDGEVSGDESDDTVSTVPTHNYQAAAQLSNIHREVGNVHTHQQLPSDPETEVEISGEEDKENFKPLPPTRKVTIEEVQDEDDVPMENTIRGFNGKVNPMMSTPTQRRQTKPATPPMVWEDKPKDKEPNSERSKRNIDIENGLSAYLKSELRKTEAASKERGSNQSWFNDPTITTLPEKVEQKDHSSTTQRSKDISEKMIPNDSGSLLDPLLPNRKENGANNAKLGPAWSQWSAASPERTKHLFPWLDTSRSASSPKYAACSGPLEDAMLEGSLASSTRRGSWTSGSPFAQDEPIKRHTLSNIKEESTVPPEAPEITQNEYSQSESDAPDHGDTDTSEVPVPMHGRRPFSNLRPSTPTAADATHCGVSTTPLLNNSNHRNRQTPSPRGNRFTRIQEAEENIGDRESPPFAPTVTAATTPSTKRRQPTFLRGLSNGSGVDNDEDYANRSLASSTGSSAGDYLQSDRENTQHGYNSWQRHHNQEREFRGQNDSPALSDRSYTTSDRRPEYNPIGSMYPNQNFGGNPMSMPLRWAQGRGMGPLSSQARFPPPGYRHSQSGNEFSHYQAQQMRQVQMKQEALLNQNPGIMGGGSSTSPSYVTGGPVYAPNPPHSLSRTNSMPIGINSAYNNGHRGSIVSLDQPSSVISNGNGYAWPQLHSQMPHPHLYNAMPTPPEIPNRSFSSENLWQNNMGAGIMRNDGSTPMQMPRTSPIAVSGAQEQNYQNQMSGMMQGWGHPAMQFGPQPNTPGSQNGLAMHGGPGRATAPPQGWMGPMQQGPEGQWVGTPNGIQMGMGMNMNMAQSMPWGSGYSA